MILLDGERRIALKSPIRPTISPTPHAFARNISIAILTGLIVIAFTRNIHAQAAIRQPGAITDGPAPIIAADGQSAGTESVAPRGDEPAPPNDDRQQAEPPAMESAESSPNIVDRVHSDLTQRMVKTAEWFDSFFDDDRYIDEENQTTLRLQFDTFFEEYQTVDFNVRARLDLKVPALEDSFENRFKIIISGDRDDGPNLDEFGDEEPGAGVTEDDQRNVTISGQYFFLDTLKRNASARAGLNFRGLQPVAFGEVRYKAEDTIDTATTRFIPRARWWTDRGWDLRADLDVEAPLFKYLFFRATLAGRWRQDSDGFFYDLRYRLFQSINERRALEYEWSNNFQTEPSHRLTRITYRISYREQIWRRWLFYEIAPEVALREFEEGSDYRFVPGILFRVEVRFDRNDLRRRKRNTR